jgi:flagellar protein FlgJ
METFFKEFPTLLGLSGTHEAFGLSGITETDKKNYVSTLYPIAEIAGKKFNINPVVILAQGAMESGWGTSYMAKNINNFFGITASGKPNDYWKGENYISKSSGLKFRKYPTIQDCFYDFARLISSNYKSAAAASFSIADYAREISNSPYAEQDPKNRAIYRKAVISNAAYILKVRGASDQSALLTNEAAKVTIPVSNESGAAQMPGKNNNPNTNSVSKESNEGGNGGILLAFGTAAAALLFFNFSNKKIKPNGHGKKNN